MHKSTQIVADVSLAPHHIACSTTTRSEIVVPVFDPAGRVRAVLDVDSDTPTAFDEVDAQYLEDICGWFKPCLPNRIFPCLHGRVTLRL